MPVRVDDLIRLGDSAPNLSAVGARPFRLAAAWPDPGAVLGQALGGVLADAFAAVRPSALEAVLDSVGRPDRLVAEDLWRAVLPVEPPVPPLPSADSVLRDAAIREVAPVGLGDGLWPAEAFARPILGVVAAAPPALSLLPDPRISSVAAELGASWRVPSVGLALAPVVPDTLAGLDAWVADPVGAALAAAQVTLGIDPFLRLPTPPWLEPGTPDGDLFLLLAGNAEPAAVLAALDRMADRVPWAARGAARDALWARAREEKTPPAKVKHRELRAAVVLVLGAAARPQYHRFGRQWHVGADRRKALLVPQDLHLDGLWEWFLDEVPKAAEAALLDRPYPATGDVFDRDPRNGDRRILPLGSNLRADPTEDPLHALLEREQRGEDVARLLGALEVASPRQRELLALIGAGLSAAEAGRRLGMSPETARQHLHRLRQKAV